MFGLETTSPGVSVAASIPVARAVRPTRRCMLTLVDVSEEQKPRRGTLTVGAGARGALPAAAEAGAAGVGPAPDPPGSAPLRNRGLGPPAEPSSSNSCL